MKGMYVNRLNFKTGVSILRRASFSKKKFFVVRISSKSGAYSDDKNSYREVERSPNPASINYIIFYMRVFSNI